MNWTILTYLDTPDLAAAALADLMAQDPQTRVLLVSNGSSAETRKAMEKAVSSYPAGTVLPWFFEPGLPSLSAVWNRALDFCWSVGASEVLVTQADVRLHRKTREALKQALVLSGALFVSAVGRREGEVDMDAELASVDLGARGGPDFSCFMLSKDCHELHRFDENYRPAFCEDVDFHRRMLLAGDGDRIFSVSVPYVHIGSGTLKSMTPERRAAVEASITAGSRAYHEQKWGGAVNEEKFTEPFQLSFAGAPILSSDKAATLPTWISERYDRGEALTTPALFDVVRAGWAR